MKEVVSSAPVRVADYQFSTRDFEIVLVTPVLTYGVDYQSKQAALKGAPSEIPSRPRGDRKKLCCLREYDEAFRDVFSRVIRFRSEEAYPLFKEIPTEPRPAIHTSLVTLPSGETLTNAPFQMKAAFRFKLSDTVSGHVDAFTASAGGLGSRVRGTDDAPAAEVQRHDQ